MKSLVFIALLSICTFNVFSQGFTNSDTLFFKNENGFIINTEPEKAEGFSLKTPFNPNRYVRKILFLQNENTMAEYECYDKSYINDKTKVSSSFPVKTGKYEEWYLSGEKKMLCYYVEDKLDGEFKVFYTNSKPKRVEKWEKGVWKAGECFDEQGNKIPYCSYQELPEFTGGLSAMFKFIGSELTYPKYARKKGIEGTVYVVFIVDRDGSIVEIMVRRGVEEHLDAEAVRVVKAMPKWKPGKFEGELVRYMFTLPVKFKLS